MAASHLTHGIVQGVNPASSVLEVVRVPTVRNTPLKRTVICSLIKSAAFLFLIALLNDALVGRAEAADMSQARSLFYSGDYEACIEVTKEQVEKGIWNDFWSKMLIKAYLETGQYAKAALVYESVKAKFSNSIPLRIAAAEAYRFSGETQKGNQLLYEIPDLVNATPWRYSDRDNMLAIGRYLLQQGLDAREVLTLFFDRALKSNSKYSDAHVAIAELALEKADYQEAVRSLKVALELQPDDPYVRFLLSKAWAPSDSEQATENLQAALELNPYHSPSLLLQARELIDAERYEASEEVLDIVLGVNAMNPDAWALKAAIANLRGEYQKQGEFRTKGLAGWNVNPQVDYLTGVVLSKHYRFEESVRHQRRALKLDPDFLPAKFQLAQDLLRVGEDEEGWKIVDDVSAKDKYNVVAFNLRTLRDRLAKFTTLEAPGLLVRMDTREAKIYGDRVVKLLLEAKEELTEKYDFDLTRPVSVEIFPQQSDFAIRTFGLPGGAGFLGVCFGSLITANSPASQGDSPSNWESVLWHEFCHVVTLQKTNNRMPRWLSEGISVYEELEKNAGWGQRMSPMYKTMILGEDFVPLSELSGAFLNPKSPLHLQFAYYESSLAVRYLIDVHGKDLLLRLLQDLGIGVTMDDAFARRYGDVQALDAGFEQYAKNAAKDFLPETDFSREGLPERPSPADLENWLKDHPNSYFALRQKTLRLIQQKDWDLAWLAAKRLEKLYPDDSDPRGSLDLLAMVARELGDADSQTQYLEKIADLSSDNVSALLRLIAIHRDEQNWEKVAEYSNQLLAVQPLIPNGHENLVQASSQLQEMENTLGSLSALQELDPLDPAGLRYELANAQFAAGNFSAARREVLLALEYSPRYREAQRLLVKIHKQLNPSPILLDVDRPSEGLPPKPKIADDVLAN